MQTVVYKTIGGTGRDAGKMFSITEMPARRAHQWATRAMFAMLNNGGNVPANLLEMGAAGLIMVGLQGLPNVPYETAEPLLNELLAGVRFIPKPAEPANSVAISEHIIEEANTYFELQNAAWDILQNAFTRAAPSISASSEAASQST